jgi:hypothetical protein
MRVMDEHNKAEALNRTAKYNAQKYNERTISKYGHLINIEVKLRKKSIPFFKFLVWFLFVLNFIYAFVGAIAIGIGEDNYESWLNDFDMNPRTETDDRKPDFENWNGPYIRVFRFMCYLFWLNALMTLVDNVRMLSLRAVLHHNKYRSRSSVNVVRYLMRPVFLYYAIANCMLIAGHPDFEWSADFFKNRLVFCITPLAQMFVTYLFYSEFFYFDTLAMPSRISDGIKVFLYDFFILNWIRVIYHGLMNLLAFILVPFNVLFSIVRLVCYVFPSCSPFDYDDDSSRTRRYLLFVAKISG